MSQYNITGFHTCKLKGEYQQVVQNIPFISRPGENQWLTQGYYFWTDSDHWAKRWLREGSRVIGKFSIALCPTTELLDLVGNVAHQQELDGYLKTILLSLPKENRNKITVNQIVTYLREKEKETNGMFPYLAIKAADQRSEDKIKFINTSACVQTLINRQQLCVFEQARERISLQGFVEPEEYVSQYSQSA